MVEACRLGSRECAQDSPLPVDNYQTSVMAEVKGTTNLWREFLESTKCGNLLPPDFKLVFIPSNVVIPEAVKVLINNKVSSVPVLDVSTNQFTGLLDILDVLTLVIATAEAKELIDVLSKKEVDWETFIRTELQVFSGQPIGELTNISERNPWAPVWEGFPLHSLLDMFSKNVNLHRVPIITGVCVLP